ncbi:TetR/AcrR family transcriptional regulator [Flammeovirga sp. EKP202]|uniref:TetR/AcrR family transcriptional regulator n=1 Tax=Flammeovirga sp. EKP202 TaxID=2770592 RepID=UPI00165FDAD7|nr:TetR/AcrR family transcriptional regulator [Flammeovirga sp. EKP202]MBD0402300.1 TetR/AcrR family transcriptional regulator [Flammeovirga sp. EKP202]
MKAKDKILKTAQDLFYAQGIKKVSVSEIYETAGVSKMTFYRQFSNKEDLVLTILRNLFNTSMLEYNTIVEESTSFRETLLRLTEMKIKYSKSMSKIFLEEFLQMFNEKVEVMKELQDMQHEGRSLFVQEIMKARASGEIRQDLSIELMLAMLDHMQAFIEDPKNIVLFESSEDVTRGIINFYFFGIYGPQE